MALRTIVVQRGYDTYQHVLTVAYRLVLQVQTDQVLGKFAVKTFIYLIEHKIEQIKTGDESWRKIDVLGHREFRIVLGANRIGCSENGGSCVQGGDDAGLRNGNCLLFLSPY